MLNHTAFLSEAHKLTLNSVLQVLPELDLFPNISLSVLREDLIHPEVSGNKLRKLKYNILHMMQAGYKGIATAGGAYSNHIAALAAAGAMWNFETLGLIRGDELHKDANHTLKRAHELGMKLHFVPRDAYRDLAANTEVSSSGLFPQTYLWVPAGGENEAGIKGCQEILNEEICRDFDYVFCAVGTGTTFKGLLKWAKRCKLFGIMVLKDARVEKEIMQYAHAQGLDWNDYNLITNRHLGGYNRYPQQLIEFIDTLKDKSGIFAEPLYTGKVFYALNNMLKNGDIPANSRVLIIHTGGLQGWISKPE